MILRAVLYGSSLSTLVVAAQPSAPEPVVAPIRDLPWGQLNFLATTDTHGWHAGHLQEPQYSADWGDYISFATRMREHADTRGVDLLLVDTGDRIDGNGLYDGSHPKGEFTYDIFKEQDVDIICTGNHELYKSDSAINEYVKTVPNFKGNYLASNLDILDPDTGDRVPMAKRYRTFTTKNQGIRVLAMGFIFDFVGNSNNTFVQRVEDTIKEAWFQDAIRKEVDIFVIIGHVALRSPEYKALYNAIRGQKWDTPIQFFGGHSHIRDFMNYDSKAYALESGRYLETIGWMSIEGISGPKGRASDDVEATASMKFQRKYIDNNLFGYHYHSGLNETTFPTEHGQNVSHSIHAARKALKLDDVYGCAPQDYWMNRAEYPSNGSMYSWFETQVLPEILVTEKRSKLPRIGIINTGGVRFDIFKGPFTRDTTYIVCPFQNEFRYIKDVPYESAKRVLKLLNSGGPVFEGAELQTWMLQPPQQMSVQKDLQTPSVRNDRGDVLDQIPLRAHGTKPSLIPGYTTRDDGGDDGDDTVHSPISFYRVPNCIESKIAFPDEGDPEIVDLVYLDFVQPWILLALKFTGQNYDSADTLPYIEGQSFTGLLEGWIKEHWTQDC
ncbi:MAG: hypothetical protein M1818_002549 [Claussenomyces sp. TS43310]|nr:MAG: hypothetical protein M1818_002549 [Claussenomyces sp. TS43310]